jgi:hypothetical protein
MVSRFGALRTHHRLRAVSISFIHQGLCRFGGKLSVSPAPEMFYDRVEKEAGR